ncbi:hypothetical protein [Winogradskyella vidalii]|uniref:hypothetical protein n=1 Tax=Winogradskyella vidalii TaxID=2615024 RepID=UPI0015C9ED04|nr:hypothetical protein [Winogradskyella vidalii]
MKKRIIYISIAMAIGAFLVGVFSAFYDSYTADEITVNQIEASLNTHCHCESISKDMYSKGVQYSNVKGFSVEHVSFSLMNCKYESLQKEANRIHQLLVNDVESLENFNLISLDIISEDRHDTITIKNGQLEI